MSFGRTWRDTLLGAVLAWAAAVLVAALLGIAPMFLFWPLYTVILVAIGLVASLGVAIGAKVMRLSPRAAMYLSALLTFGSFAALVLRIMASNAEGGRW